MKRSFSCGESLRCSFLFETTQRQVEVSPVCCRGQLLPVNMYNMTGSHLLFHRQTDSLVIFVYLFSCFFLFVFLAHLMDVPSFVLASLSFFFTVGPLQQHVLLFLGLIDAATTTWVPLCDGWPNLNVISSSSLVFSVRSASDSGQRPSAPRTNSEGHGSLKTKEHSPNPDRDKAAGKKSSDSGEEADKDFILIWNKWGIESVYFCLY